jgi:hypothetical protein
LKTHQKAVDRRDRRYVNDRQLLGISFESGNVSSVGDGRRADPVDCGAALMAVAIARE